MKEKNFVSEDNAEKCNSVPLPHWYFKDEDGKPVSTFIPRVIGLVEIKTSKGIETSIRLRLCFESGEDKETLVSSEGLDYVDWTTIDCRCILNSKYPKPKAYIANVIRAGTNSIPKEIQYRLDKLGIYHIGDKILFNGGDRVITQSSEKDPMHGFIQAKMPFRLDIDPKLDKAEMFKGMFELIYIGSGIGKLLVAHATSGIMRAVFKEAGCKPCTVLFIVGESGMLKSHYVPHMVQLYNRSDGIKVTARFNSTTRFIEDAICGHDECTVVIDDLHTAESKSIKRINETTAEEIIRRIGDDNGRGRMEGKERVKNEFGGNVIFIGEYCIGMESTIPRELVAGLTIKPDGKILDRYQREKPLLVSTFYYYFIQWYVDNYNEIRDEINVRFTKFRQETSDPEIHGRIGDTFFYLLISFMFFIEFCNESGFMSDEDAKEEYGIFRHQLIKLIHAQQARFKSDEEKADNIDYLKLIRKLYKHGKIRIAKNDKAYKPEKHDALIHYKCLCLRREILDKLLREVQSDVNINEVIEALMNIRALKCDKYTNKNIIKINSKNENVRGKCFYGIFLNKLE